MQSLIIAEDLHQGQFIQQGFKYESISTTLLSVKSSVEELANGLAYCDNIFLLIRNLDLLEQVLPDLALLHCTVPIMVLAQEYDVKLVELLKAGKIYHFFTRPLSFRFIANEVRSVVYQQREQDTYQVLKVRELELNRDTHEVRWNGQSIFLRHKEFILLEFLMLNAGKLLSREIILESVWDRNANMFTNTVDVHINKLRKKIDYSVKEKFIHTIHCTGYIFS